LPIVFYDNDEVGKAAAQKLQDAHGLPITNMDDYYALSKDFSDQTEYWAKDSFQENTVLAKKRMTEIIINIIKNHNWTQWNI